MKQSWNVPDDFWVMQQRSRWLRTLRLTIEGEPEQKGARGRRSAVAFQQQVIHQMTAARRRAFTGPVALDLFFQTTRKNPPAIHRVAKHVLDLLGPADPAIRPRRRSVLYRDDRQVKFLYVDLDQAWNRDELRTERTMAETSFDPWDIVAPLPSEEPRPSRATPDQPHAGPPTHGGRSSEQLGRTMLIARPGRDVVADLTLANRLRQLDDYEEDEDSGPFAAPDLPDDFEDDPNGRTASTAEDAGLWEYIERSSRFWWLTRFQGAVLAQMDAALLTGLCMYFDGLSQTTPPGCPEPYRSDFDELLHDGRTMSRRQLLAHPLTLALPGLPRNGREGEEFKSALRQRMEEFKVRRPMFSLLTVPVKMTFLVVPPEQGKDLDNIALTALPIAHEVLRPHIEPHLLAPQPPDDEPPGWQAEALRRLRSLNANSVTAYQVIELPRTPEDPPEGLLRLALGADSHRSWWDQAADYVDERIATADDLSEWDLRRW
ncbi:hypothetical protein [Microbispora sp. GKU 823]|uniref:hypothetical protein n=1 Tax=Microbispora sp. GKU 823 TaxID=1652100 RepID=UPI00117C7B95|nr:hypothetical protein [Microbispora sp. GKU 823]